VKFDKPSLKIFQSNAASDVVKLITHFELLVERRVRAQETSHQVALAQVESLEEKCH
jgi:hypothetical protein